MSPQRCITFFGKRLEGQKVCLFDDFPVDLSKTSFSSGVPDVCHKLQYPKPRACRVLSAHSVILAEISFRNVLGFYPIIWSSVYSGFYPSPQLAWGALWSGGPHVNPDPYQNVFYLNCVCNDHDVGGGLWRSDCQLNNQGMIMPVSLLDPSWKDDDSVTFEIAFNSPVINGAPAFSRLLFREFSVPFNSGPFVSPVYKASFYEDDVLYEFECGPRGFDYSSFLSLPLLGIGPQRGWSYNDMHSFNFRLVVRRGLEGFKACWSESELENAKIAAVVDVGSGLVVGPPIKL